jgi:hypothetical protein
MEAMSFPLCRKTYQQAKQLGLASRRGMRTPSANHPLSTLAWLGKDLTLLLSYRQCTRPHLCQSIRYPNKLVLANCRAIRIPDAIHPINASRYIGTDLTLPAQMINLHAAGRRLAAGDYAALANFSLRLSLQPSRESQPVLPGSLTVTKRMRWSGLGRRRWASRFLSQRRRRPSASRM